MKKKLLGVFGILMMLSMATVFASTVNTNTLTNDKMAAYSTTTYCHDTHNSHDTHGCNR